MRGSETVSAAAAPGFFAQLRPGHDTDLRESYFSPMIDSWPLLLMLSANFES